MALRDQVRERANDQCEYCRLPQRGTILPHEQDHIKAQKHKGPTTFENLCWACSQCNGAKGPNIAGYDPETGEISAIFDPRRHVWMKHFEWDGGRLTGKTPEGRTTVEVLNINDPERLEHRLLLMDADAFYE